MSGRRRLYDAGSITAAVLLVRGSADFWSRPADLQEIPDGTHFLHLERAVAGRAQLLELLGEALR